MAPETTNYQCPNCSGRLDYDGASGMLVCASCKSTFSPQEIERLYANKQEQADEEAQKRNAAEAAAQRTASENEREGAPGEEPAAQSAPDGGSAAQGAPGAAAPGKKAHPAPDEDPIQTYLKRVRWEDADAEGMRSYTCPSCGAELLVDSVTAVTSCPYCGNNTVVPGQLAGLLKPDFVIPFEKTRDDAVAALNAHYRKKRFLPSSFTSENHLEDVQGVYVPFWLYDAQAKSSGTFEGLRETTWSDDRNMYVKTDHFDVSRRCSMSFAEVPVDGSQKMPDAHMDAIEPFDYGKMQPFSIGYLPGFLTDRYDEDAEACRARAAQRMRETAIDAMRDTVTGYSQVIDRTADASVSWDRVSYALLPVWMLHTSWNGEDFLFAMNGQTGKVVGDLPVERRKVVLRFLALFAPTLVVLFALFVFLLDL